LKPASASARSTKIKGELSIWGTFQAAPHVIRTVVALIAKIPGAQIHVISPDIGGGFGNKVGRLSGLHLRGGRFDRYRASR